MEFRFTPPALISHDILQTEEYVNYIYTNQLGARLTQQSLAQDGGTATSIEAAIQRTIQLAQHEFGVHTPFSWNFGMTINGMIPRTLFLGRNVPLSEMRPQQIMDLIDTILGSSDYVRPMFSLKFFRVRPHHPIHGRGKRDRIRLRNGDIELFIRRKRGVVEIAPESDDWFEEGTCIEQWIALGLAYSNDMARYEKMLHGRTNQKFPLRALYAKRVAEELQIYGVIENDWQKLQIIERNYQVNLCIFHLDETGNLLGLFYPAMEDLPRMGPEKTIYGILYESDRYLFHMALVTNPATLFDKMCFCEACYESYNPRKGCTHCQVGAGEFTLCVYCHICTGLCRSCWRKECFPEDEEFLVCDVCRVAYNNEECMVLHQCCGEKPKRGCALCSMNHSPKLQCYEYKCKCGSIVNRENDAPHQCYIPPKKAKKPSDQWAVYDFESAMSMDVERNKDIHLPYLVTMWFPTNPFDRSYTEKVQVAGGTREDHEITVLNSNHKYQLVQQKYRNHIQVVNGKAVYVFLLTWGINQFIQFLLESAFEGWTFFAHNGRGYDHILIKYQLIQKGYSSIDIRRGEKLLQMYYPRLKITFRDSLSFIPCPLRAFPKAFNLIEIKKGFFPHSIMNAAYVWALPFNGRQPKPNYEAFHMEEESIEIRHEFREWYEEWISEGDDWDVLEEATKYCISDTILLGEGLMAFKTQVMGMTQQRLDPLQYSTLPAAMMNYYLSYELPMNTIGVIDRGQRLESQVAHYWLQWIRESTGRELEYEVHIGKYWVDALHRPTKTIYEFYGCYWHGCLRCYRREAFHTRLQCTFAMVNHRTQARRQELSYRGYIMEEIWECEWRTQQEQMEVKTFMTQNERQLEVSAPLDPRRAYRGGMVEYYYMSYPGKIIHRDFVSEYPSICLGQTEDYIQGSNHRKLNWPMPIGIPVMIRPASIALYQQHRDRTGVIKVKVHPPRQLFTPFLGYSVPTLYNSNMMENLNGLCRVCMRERRRGWCTHTFDERCIVDTWTLPGIRYAESIGYTIVEVYEMWVYENASEALFANFLIPFMVEKMRCTDMGKVGKLVQEGGVLTEQGKELSMYIGELTGDEDPQIQYEENPARRFTAKQMMNSFTGKLGQREDLPSSDIYDKKRLYECRKVLLDPNNEIQDITVDKYFDMVSVSYLPKHRSTTGQFEKNDIIVAHITEYGRIMLNRALCAAGERALYCDTDSIFYIAEGADPFESSGMRMGDFTVEDVGKNFAVIQRKSYSYEKWVNEAEKEEEKKEYEMVCKQKGIHMKALYTQQYTPEQLRRLLWNTYNLNEEYPQVYMLPKELQKDLYAEFDAEIKTSQTQFITQHVAEGPVKMTYTMDKIIRFQAYSPKRWILWEEVVEGVIKTLPYGWCETP